MKFRILFFLSLCFLNCGKQAPPRISSIRIGIESEPVTMDPHAHNDSVTRTVQANIYEGLVAFDAEMRIVPALAVRWENPDPSTWQFLLRENVHFHNGHVMTSSDVAYSLRRAMDDPASQCRSKLAGVKEVVIRSVKTIEIRTEVPDPVLLNRLTSIYMVPAGTSAGSFDRSLGTGPYELVSWEKGRFVRLKRFPHYWGTRPEIEEAYFIPLTDRSLRAAALLRGKVDLLRGLSIDLVPEIQKDSNTKVIAASGTTVSYLGFQYGRKDDAFDDPRMRRAIYLAIDVNRNDISYGQNYVPNQPVPPSVFGYNPSLPQRHRDVELARKLLAEMHFPRTTKLTLEMPENSKNQFGRWLQQDMQEVGLDVEILSYPWKEFYSRLMQGKPSFYLIAWSCSSGDASEFLDSCIHTPGGGFGDCNVGHYSNPELDRMIEKSQSIMNNKDRRALLQQIMKVVMTDLPIVPTDFQDEYYGARRNVEWTPRADGRVLARDVRLSAVP